MLPVLLLILIFLAKTRASSAWVRLTEDGQTCESEGLEPIPDVSECQEAIESLNGGAPITNDVDERESLTAPFGCSTGCVSRDYYFCERFNTLKSKHNRPVDSSRDFNIYCRSSTSTEIEPKCEQWCKPHRMPWKVKCAWDTQACSGCDECKGPMEQYVIGDRGSSCPAGYGVIDSESQCREACKDLGWEEYRHGSRTAPNYPFGCIENTAYCYFNFDDTDPDHQSRSRVCKLLDSVIWTVTRDWKGEQFGNTKSKVSSFYGLPTDQFHLECDYSAYCEQKGFGSTAYWLHNQEGRVKEAGGYFCCSQREISGWNLYAEIATPVEWTVTQDWTGEQWPNTKSKVRTFRGLSTDEFHLECKYSKYCEENGHGTTAYWLYDQRGNVVENSGFFCCEQRDIDDWTITATSTPLSADADFDISQTSVGGFAVEESMTAKFLRNSPVLQTFAIIGVFSIIFSVFRAFLSQKKYEGIQDEEI